MNISEFAEKHQLKTKTDSCGDPVIPGRPRNLKRPEDRLHIYEGDGDGRLGLCYVQYTDRPQATASVGKYHNAQKRLLQAGFVQRQSGDAEGTFLFDGANSAQARLAIREIGARVRRTLSPEKTAALAARLSKARNLRSSATEKPRPRA